MGNMGNGFSLRVTKDTKRNQYDYLPVVSKWAEFDDVIAERLIMLIVGVCCSKRQSHACFQEVS
jgi:hypothetical protein